MSKKQLSTPREKGFTLIELIVAIAIMGVLLIIALPQVSRIQSANKDKKYQTYEKAIVSGSKLYIDSYAKDLFGNNNSGCVRIKYSELKNKNLAKDFGAKSISCGNDNTTYVEVRKVVDEYKYKINMVCINTETKKEVYKTKEITGAENSCSLDPDLAAPIITLSPKDSAGKWYNSKNLAVKIKVSDVSGLNNNTAVTYNWYNKTTGKITAKGNHNYKNKKGTENVSYTIPTSKRPQDAGGKYVLEVTPDDSRGSGVQDALGNKTLTATKAEEYWIDNEAPKFSGSISSGDSRFSSKNIWIYLNATDNFTPANSLKVYISNTGYETGGSWRNYTTGINWTVSGNYNGGTRTIYVSIKDLAGNITKRAYTYTVYRECSSVMDDGNWYDTGSCSKACGGGTKPQEKKKKDQYLGTYCGKDYKTATCNTMDCCSSITYENGKNCTVTCGGGTKNRIAYSAYDGRRCPNQDTSSGGERCNVQGCCDSVYYKNGTNCTVSCGGGTYNQLAYSNYNHTRCPSKDKSSGGSKCNTKSCCEGPTTTYTKWSSCSAKCGGGKQTRKKTVTQCNGSTSTKTETQNCNTQACCSKTASSWSYGSYSGCQLFTGYSKTQTHKRRQRWKNSAYNSSVKCNTSWQYTACSLPSHSHSCKLVGAYHSWGAGAARFECGCWRTDGYRVHCDKCGAYCNYHICTQHWNANGYHK